jgi:hypothetical protein
VYQHFRALDAISQAWPCAVVYRHLVYMYLIECYDMDQLSIYDTYILHSAHPSEITKYDMTHDSQTKTVCQYIHMFYSPPVKALHVRRCHAFRFSRSNRRSSRTSCGRLIRLVLSKSVSTILPSRSIISSCSSAMAAWRRLTDDFPCDTSISFNFPSTALLTTHAAKTEKRTKGTPAVSNKLRCFLVEGSC